MALAVLAVLWLASLVWALLTSLKHEADTATVPLEVVPDRGFTLDAYASVLGNAGLITWFVNSTVVTVVVTVLTVALSAAAAYGFSRTPVPRPAVSIFVFIHAWNNFRWPFIIISDPALMTLPVGLVQVQSSFGVRYAR